MNSTLLKKSLSGLALMVGLVTGTALGMVPGAVAEASPSRAAPAVTVEGDTSLLPRICTLSCRDCLLTPCGPDEGTCANTRCL